MKTPHLHIRLPFFWEGTLADLATSMLLNLDEARAETVAKIEMLSRLESLPVWPAGTMTRMAEIHADLDARLVEIDAEIEKWGREMTTEEKS